jgi:ketosteroid isomerase-like protein
MSTHTVLARLRRAVDEHDLDGMEACFHPTYVSEQPAHPERGFSGADQVRRNWSKLFEEIPDLRVERLAECAAGDEAWAEWRFHGARRDGSAFDYRGVVIFGLRDGLIASGRFYFELVETQGGGIEEATHRLSGRDRPRG